MVSSWLAGGAGRLSVVRKKGRTGIGSGDGSRGGVAIVSVGSLCSSFIVGSKPAIVVRDDRLEAELKPKLNELFVRVGEAVRGRWDLAVTRRLPPSTSKDKVEPLADCHGPAEAGCIGSSDSLVLGDALAGIGDELPGVRMVADIHGRGGPERRRGGTRVPGTAAFTRFPGHRPEIFVSDERPHEPTAMFLLVLVIFIRSKRHTICVRLCIASTPRCRVSVSKSDPR